MQDRSRFLQPSGDSACALMHAAIQLSRSMRVTIHAHKERSYKIHSPVSLDGNHYVFQCVFFKLTYSGIEGYGPILMGAEVVKHLSCIYTELTDFSIKRVHQRSISRAWPRSGPWIGSLRTAIHKLNKHTMWTENENMSALEAGGAMHCDKTRPFSL